MGITKEARRKRTMLENGKIQIVQKIVFVLRSLRMFGMTIDQVKVNQRRHGTDGMYFFLTIFQFKTQVNYC